MSDQITLTNPQGDKWTSGSRGKPPKWVSEHPEYLAFKANKPLQVTRLADVPLNVSKESLMKYWRFVGLNAIEDEVKTKVGVNCYVAAETRVDALTILGKVFSKFPVGSMELEKMWREVTPNEYMNKDAGFYELKGEVWTKR